MDANDSGGLITEPAGPEKSGRVRSGKARMEKMSLEERKELGRKAAKKRWSAINTGIQPPGEIPPLGSSETQITTFKPNNLPIAKWPGILKIGNSELACYVLEDGRRVISRGAATGFLTDGKGGGNLEQYIEVEALREYIPESTVQLIEFDLPTVVNRQVKGVSAETFIEICQAYVAAWQAEKLTTDRQRSIAMKAAIFLAACAKIGLIAMIDEVTGYQYDRPVDALQFKLKVFLAEEMRKWDRTFPNELWEQFGRLTKWTGPVHVRPKFWGKLVMELVYEYLDADVAQWLRENAPRPMKGRNYHQWLTEQYGLKKLVEHIWKVIGVASTCENLPELKSRMQEIYGKRSGYQFEFRLVASKH